MESIRITHKAPTKTNLSRICPKVKELRGLVNLNSFGAPSAVKGVDYEKSQGTSEAKAVKQNEVGSNNSQPRELKRPRTKKDAFLCGKCPAREEKGSKKFTGNRLNLSLLRTSREGRDKLNVR